jgi:hypothetical protein
MPAGYYCIGIINRRDSNHRHKLNISHFSVFPDNSGEIELSSHKNQKFNFYKETMPLCRLLHIETAEMKMVKINACIPFRFTENKDYSAERGEDKGTFQQAFPEFNFPSGPFHRIFPTVPLPICPKQK